MLSLVITRGQKGIKIKVVREQDSVNGMDHTVASHNISLNDNSRGSSVDGDFIMDIFTVVMIFAVVMASAFIIAVITAVVMTSAFFQAVITAVIMAATVMAFLGLFALLGLLG